MSSKFSAVCLGLVLSAGSVGCASSWMSRDEYERSTQELREHRDALEAENAALRIKGADYDRLKGELEANGESAKFYTDLAASLRKALSGVGIEAHEIEVHPDGRVVFATDVLFDVGSWNLTPRGKDILAKFAQTQKSNVMKIVGHTDKKPIVSPGLKKALDTDTNKELSVKRAIAVMGELLHAGIREGQIASVEGHGSSEPKKSDKESRRVEIFIVPGAQVAPTSFKAATKPVKK